MRPAIAPSTDRSRAPQDLGLPGFEGFAQAQPFVPAPDLVIVNVTEEQMPCVRMGAASVQGGPAETRRVEGTIDPGETRTISILWSTTGHAGRISMQAIADPWPVMGAIVESNEADNARSFETYVLHPLADSPT